MAKRVTKGLDLYRETVALLASVHGHALEGHRILAEGGERDLHDILSGTLTPKQTRGAFARGPSGAKSTPTGRRRSLSKRQMANRGLTTAVPLNPINKQSERLVQGVVLRRKATGRALQEYDLGLEGVEYAKYVLAVGGTRFMVARQVQADLKRRFGPRNKAFHDTFVRYRP